MDLVTEVNEFIEKNILQSNSWDTASEIQKQKAVNQAQRTLKRLFPKTYAEDIPVEDIAEQCVWILKIDDMFQRAELGATYLQVDGIAINMSSKDRSVCPFIMEKLNLSEGFNARRKVGRYATAVSDSFRKGW